MMKSRKRIVFLLAACAVSTISLFLHFHNTSRGTTPRDNEKVNSMMISNGEDCKGAARDNASIDCIKEEVKISAGSKSMHDPSFVFITNTEECLEEYWLTDEFLGDPSKCDCDSIVISYHRPCKTNTKSHITYLYNPQANTLTKGKNFGVSVARSRSERNYIYYVIHDDDVEYHYTGFQSDGFSRTPPLRYFQKFLLIYRPAVGVPTFSNYRQRADYLWSFRWDGCGLDPSNVTSPITHFDACTYALHATAVPHLYPLPEGISMLDGVMAHGVLRLVAMVIFPTQRLAFLGVITINRIYQRYYAYSQMTSDEKRVHAIPVNASVSISPRLLGWGLLVRKAKQRIAKNYQDLPLTQYLLNASLPTFSGVRELICQDDATPRQMVIPYLNTSNFQSIHCEPAFTNYLICP